MPDNYCISRFYRSRTEYHHLESVADEDGWQLEVYLHALGLMKKHGLDSIVDIGCGSAYKLVTYFSEYETLGLELPINLEGLREKYPDRRWEESDFTTRPNIVTDVVVCSDVIEHLIDPGELLEYIKCMTFKYLVLSTPDRNLLYRPWNRGFFGPPVNPAHTREWTFREFGDYVSMHFDLIDHRVTNLHQGTQMVICRAR